MSFARHIERIISSFTEGEWVTVYERNATQNRSTLVFCCLVDLKKRKDYLEYPDWEIQPGAEGKPDVTYTGTGVKYRTLAHKGLEPLIFARSFNWNGGYDAYTDISEEFVLYFNLYVKAEDRCRKYFFIDALGRLDKVILVEEDTVKIRLKYLMEYLSVRKKHLAVCFDFVQIDETAPENAVENTEVKGGYFMYVYQADPVFSGKQQVRIHGKTLIAYKKGRTFTHRLVQQNRKYADFITGYDHVHDRPVMQNCKTDENKYLVPTYFKKKVLDKYYRNPGMYKVGPYAVRSNTFTLKMDNTGDHVVVYLIELGMLPYKEQLHWKKYNIGPR